MERLKTESLEKLVQIDPEQLSNFTDPEYTFYYIDISAVSTGKISFPAFPIKFKDAPSRARKILHEGDILMSTVRPNLESFARFKAPSRKSVFIASTGFAVLRSRENTDINYVYHSLFSSSVHNQIESLVVGSNYPAINTGDVRQLKITIPSSKSEQNRIAQILSTADEAIAQTEVLIAKYGRIKTGLMQDLLTRGIDEQGNIRNEATHTFEVKNGIKVPVEWEVKPASELIHIINGGTPKTNVKEYWENGTIPWLSVEDFNNGRRYVTGSIKHITKEGLNKSATKLLPRNALIISARGTVGVISQLGIEMTFNQSCYGLISKNESIISNDYLYYALKQVFNSGSVSKSGSVFDTITKITFDEIKICYPSNPDEFHKITSILGKHDLFLEQQQTNLAKLQSLKTGLMQDLLSRKVRVPEEVKEELF